MENLSINELLEKYPYLKAATKNHLFIKNSELEELKESDVIEVDGVDVKIDFLKKVLEDDRYYSYVKKYFNGEIKDFHVVSIYMGDTIGNIGYSKLSIIKGIEYLIQNNFLFLNGDVKKRFNELKDSISFDKFLQKINDEIYNVSVDGINYNVPIRKIINFMMISEEELDKICNDSTITEIEGIKKTHFIYMAFKYVRNSGILNDFIVPKNIHNRYNDIKSLQKIDLQALNQLLETTDTLYKEVKINDNLEKMIIEGIPEDATDLEKAIYVYIKMCKIFTYDDEYFAFNQKGEVTKKHKDVNYVSNINQKNNKIVCFEFNLIYAKILNSFGINFSSNYEGMVGEAYGTGHANLKFRCGKYLIKADSVTSILHGDIMQAKLNQPLKGLKCINYNTNTNEEFNEAVTKMYTLIINQEKDVEKNFEVEHIQTFYEIMKEYEKITKNIKSVGLNEKLSILIDKVNSTKMVGIDALSYILQLRKVLFNDLERGKNILITILKNNNPSNGNELAMATAIFTLNPYDYNINEEETLYYYYDPNNKFTPISKEKLQLKFDEGEFEYIEAKDPRIPGIKEKELSI